MSVRLSRRTVLRGTGVMIALPMLEAMVHERPRLAHANASDGLPRLITFFVTNGLPLEFFTPPTPGDEIGITPLIEPLAHHAADINVVTGITGVGGPDAHAAGICAFSTGVPCTQLGAGGPSIEQVAAEHLGHETSFRSLAVAVRNSGSWSSNGFSSACFTNISWAGPEVPVPADRDPSSFFERLFGDGTPDAAVEAELRAARRRSVLDYVQSDITRVQSRVGAGDRMRLEAHLDAVREVEKRIGAIVACEHPDPPSGYPTETWQQGYYERARVMMDLLVMALSCDLTRYASFMLDDGGSDGAPDLERDLHGHHHELAHAGNREAMRQFSTVHMEAFAHFIDRLSTTFDGESGSTLLDKSLVYMGTELGDGTAHTREDLPFILAGRAAGNLSTGRHLHFPGEPLAALQLGVLKTCGVPVEDFGGQQGALSLGA